MKLVEKHIIKPGHDLHGECDSLCFKSKNLYNYANYLIRQEFISSSKEKEDGNRDHANYLNYHSINKGLKQQDDYIALPRKVSNQTLMLLDKNWKSFFKSIKDWKKNPHKYKSRPKLPGYKNKINGRSSIIFELGAVSKKHLKNGIIKLSQNNIKIPFINNECDLKQVRIIPKITGYYVIEIVYEKKEEDLNLNNENKLSIDIGVDNLMSLTSNKMGFKPLLVNGRPLKSINQYYNKMNSDYKSELPQKAYSSEKIRRLTQKRNNKIENYLHNSSKFIINLCKKENIGEIIIGKNDNWKQGSKMGKTNNQNFVTIPFNNLINQIKYKGDLVGIKVIIREESYSSKASFLDLDDIPNYDSKKETKHRFSGYRKTRGMYKSRIKSRTINADINGSYNIMRKEFPNIFNGDGIEGIAVCPVRVKSIEEYHKFL